jgi:hypothetical protein
MAHVFICYRRNDSQTMAGRIFDYLESKYGQGNIFKDVNSIPYGDDFISSVIVNEIPNSDVVLIILGPTWLTADTKGQRRLDNPKDVVRLEIETALRYSDKLLIPVLVPDSRGEMPLMPSGEELPESLLELARKNAASVRNDPDFRADMEKLVKRIDAHLEGRTIKKTTEEVKLDNWLAVFFPRPDLSGTGIPVAGINKIDFKWGTQAPTINGVVIPISNCVSTNPPISDPPPGTSSPNCSEFYSVRFVAEASLNEGNYQFKISSNDGVRLYVNETAVLDKFVTRPFVIDTANINLAAGSHKIQSGIFS